MRYPVVIEPDGDTFMVSFPDLPGVFSQGDTVEDALRHAVDALETGLMACLEAGEDVPAPSAVERGQYEVAARASFSAKVLLVLELAGQGVRQADLARRLAMTPSEVTRLVDLRHTSKIDALSGALAVLGKHLKLTLD